MQPQLPQDHRPKQFTTRRRDVQFEVDGELFTGVPALPVMAAVELGSLQETLQNVTEIDEKLTVAVQIFEVFLVPDSFQRFKTRLGDKERPIDMATLIEITQWIIGEGYGMRPTQSQSPSGSTPNATGRPSTDGALPEASILSGSTGLVSST